MTATQLHLTDSETEVIQQAADATGWRIDTDNDVCLELVCETHGELLGIWSPFILAVARDEPDLADTLANEVHYSEHGYRWWLEFPKIAPLGAGLRVGSRQEIEQYIGGDMLSEAEIDAAWDWLKANDLVRSHRNGGWLILASDEQWNQLVAVVCEIGANSSEES